MRKIVDGYIIEAEKDGYYYHRTGSWIKYDSPTQAYVWPEKEAKEILESARENPKAWRLNPDKLHPATFYSAIPAAVEINRPKFDAELLGSSRCYGGQMFEDIGTQANRFEVATNLIASNVSL